jgi:hypothetical protein
VYAISELYGDRRRRTPAFWQGRPASSEQPRRLIRPPSAHLASKRYHLCG